MSRKKVYPKKDNSVDALNQTKSFEERSKSFELKDPYEAEAFIFHLRQLLNIAKVLSSTLEINDVLDRIIYSCFGQFQVEKAAIFLYKDIDNPDFTLTQQRGYDEDVSIDIPVDSNILEFFRQNLFSVRHRDLQKVRSLHDELETLSVLEPIIYVPFRNKNEVNGLLILSNKLTGENYVDDELDFLTTLAGFAGLAIANATFYELAILDRMTKLYHHHHFKEVLKEEIEKTIENKSSFTLIMFDIDHFKKFNDKYGHQQGDIILIELANIIKGECKYKFIPARYGGEEFTIILPKVKEKEGEKFASNLRKKISSYAFSGPNGKSLSITASFGVSQFNNKDHSEILIKKVDTALYKSKHDGRNKVTVYSDELADFMENREGEFN